MDLLLTRPRSRSVQDTAPTYSFASSRMGAERMFLLASSCVCTGGGVLQCVQSANRVLSLDLNCARRKQDVCMHV